MMINAKANSDVLAVVVMITRQGVGVSGIGAFGKESRPSLDELHYAVASVQLRKLIAQRQKLELEKSNLRLDLLVKEEHLNQEYGKGKWHKLLRADTVDPPYIPCSGACSAACLSGGACASATNRSQNRQDSTTSFPIPQGQVGTGGWGSDSDEDQGPVFSERVGEECGEAEGRSVLHHGWTEAEDGQCRQEHGNVTCFCHPQRQECFDTPSSHTARKQCDKLNNDRHRFHSDMQRKDCGTETENVKIRKRRHKKLTTKQKKGSGEPGKDRNRVMKRLSWSFLAFKLSK